MEAEMADVIAAIGFVAETFCLDRNAIANRADAKLHHFRCWHADPNN